MQITTRAGKSWIAEVVEVVGDLVATRSTDRVAASAAAPASSRVITVERVGRRSYLRGDTLAVRGMLRAAGCHWDADARAWWIGDHATATDLALKGSTAPAEAAPKRQVTHCVGCGSSLSEWSRRRGMRFCSRDCANDHRMGGQSGYIGGRWHQGSDD